MTKSKSDRIKPPRKPPSVFGQHGSTAPVRPAPLELKYTKDDGAQELSAHILKRLPWAQSTHYAAPPLEGMATVCLTADPGTPSQRNLACSSWPLAKPRTPEWLETSAEHLALSVTLAYQFTGQGSLREAHHVPDGVQTGKRRRKGQPALWQGFLSGSVL